jgi:citrate lyase gamma subunit
VIEFHNLKGEKADVLPTYIVDVLDKYKLSNKIIAFCGDNCNKNFGGAARKGINNVFAKLTTSDLKMNICGKGCVSHILHNALRTSADILPVDIEAIVNKIFQLFPPYQWKN